MRGELGADNARGLEHPQGIAGQRLQPRFDDGAYPGGDRRAQRRELGAELPAGAAWHEQPVLEEVIEERGDGERVAVTPIDEQWQQIRGRSAPGNRAAR